MKKDELEQAQKELVLARFKTLNPDSKIMLGGSEEVTVREIMDRINEGDEFGKNVVMVHMKMLKLLSSNCS